MSLLRPVAISLLGLSAGFAQNEATPPPLITPSAPGTPVPAPPVPGLPAANPGAPAAPAAPGAANGVAPLADQKITQPIVFPKITGTDLAGLYRQYTGRRVIVSSAAALAEFSFVQDASPADPLTNAQAAELLKKAAALENFVFVPDATDPNLDMLTFSAGGINPKSVGVGIFTESDTLPEGGTVISYVMNLKYLKPDEAVRTFTAVIGQFGSYGSITPVANASSVVITENASLIRRLIQLKEEIDKPSSQVGTRFIKVEYADVTELATTLNELLNAQQTAQRTAGVQRTGGNAAPPPVPNGTPVNIDGGGGEGGGGSSGEESPPQIVADPRTNRIFAMGRPVDLVFIEGLVAQFDTQSDSRNSIRRRLSYLSAVDFLPIAEQALLRAFTSGGAASGAAPAGGAGAAGGARGGAGGTGGGATARNAGGGTSSSQFGSGSSGSMRSSGSGTTRGTTSGGLADPENNVAPQPLLVGRTLLVADTITNSVVVQGPPASVEIINKLLDEIDVKAEQVMISCVFGQLTLNKDFEFGVDYLRLLNNDIAGRGGSGAFADLPVNGNSFSPGPLTGALNGLGVYGKIGDWRFMLNALDASNKFEVLSRPTVFMANNQKGTISSGRQIAVPTSSFAATSGVQSSTNFEFRDVALTLEVIPLVNSPTEITLKIFIVNQDLGPNRNVGQGLVIPDILSRELLTTVTVPNQETIVLGGLITTRETKDKTGIPVLSQIPYVGGLFGKSTTNKEREELLIFIQPSIVADRPSLDAAQVDMDSRYDLTPNARKFADGPGVLPPPDLIPLNEKGTTTTTKKKVIVVDPAATPANAYPHGTRFRSSPR